MNLYFQVNGKDVSNSSHDEALTAFLAAEEPIMIEVLRRAPTPAAASDKSIQRLSSSSSNPKLASSSSDVSKPPSKRNSCSFPLTSTGDLSSHNDFFDEHEDVEDDDLLIPDLDYEVSVQDFVLSLVIGTG